MPPLEAWEKVLVNGESFPGTVHGLVGCVGCHGGTQSAEKEVAHADMVVNPSAEADGVCSQCHPHITASAETNLHNNLAGYWTVLEARGASPHKLGEAFSNHCTSCHTTCSDCHISQPNSVGGGFIDGHNFKARPSMTRNCTACHGSRVGNEYLGKHEGLMADVHFRQGRMDCVACHDGDHMHGQPQDCTECHEGPESAQLPPPDHRYSGAQQPSCEACHVTAATKQDDILMHKLHGSKLSCQVCHSISYSSCDGCHVAISAETGNPYYATEGTYFTFLIGKNPIQTYERPYEFVPLRHVPISTTNFEYYGENLLPEFNKVETWKYATPHNIQRFTPQNQSCNYCHGNADIFLTADKVKPEELEANLDVIVDQIPPAILSADQIPDVFGP